MSLPTPSYALPSHLTADAPAPGTELPAHCAGCFGCGEFDGGLRMRFTTGEGSRAPRGSAG